MTIILNLKPEIEAGLLSHAQATGMMPEAHLQHLDLVEKELSAEPIEAGPSEGNGMV